MDHVPTWFLVVLLVAPPCIYALGVLHGGWLWHRATTGNRSPVPQIRPAAADGVTKQAPGKTQEQQRPLPRVMA